MSTLLSSLLTTFGKKTTTSKAGLPSQKGSQVKSNKQPKPKKQKANKPQKQQVQDPALTNQARDTAREIITFAREEADKIRLQAKEEMQSLRSSLTELQNKLNSQSSELDNRQAGIGTREKVLEDKQAGLAKLKDELEEIKKKQVVKLEKIASLTRDKAKGILLEAVDKKITRDIAERLRAAEDEYKEKAE